MRIAQTQCLAGRRGFPLGEREREPMRSVSSRGRYKVEHGATDFEAYLAIGLWKLSHFIPNNTPQTSRSRTSQLSMLIFQIGNSDLKHIHSANMRKLQMTIGNFHPQTSKVQGVSSILAPAHLDGKVKTQSWWHLISKAGLFVPISCWIFAGVTGLDGTPAREQEMTNNVWCTIFGPEFSCAIDLEKCIPDAYLNIWALQQTQTCIHWSLSLLMWRRPLATWGGLIGVPVNPTTQWMPGRFSFEHGLWRRFGLLFGGPPSICWETCTPQLQVSPGTHGVLLWRAGDMNKFCSCFLPGTGVGVTNPRFQHVSTALAFAVLDPK